MDVKLEVESPGTQKEIEQLKHRLDLAYAKIERLENERDLRYSPKRAGMKQEVVELSGSDESLHNLGLPAPFAPQHPGTEEIIDVSDDDGIAAATPAHPVKRQRREERGKDDHKPRIKKENAVVALPEDSVRTLQGRYAGRAVISGTRRINPHLPTRPGYPGLMCSLLAKLCGYTWGEYLFLLVGSMTPAQFADQTDAFHEAWADKISRTVKFDEYVRMHAEIGLRRWHCGITEESVATEMAHIRNKQGLAVTEAEFVEALRRGEQAPMKHVSIMTDND
ncbi:hypothetical protein C8R44DRAFT_976563 [Mycena epipterygia]|nr:hypothetical protein C8R44DRAFT_976563 [Mycena epipterygia]